MPFGFNRSNRRIHNRSLVEVGALLFCMELKVLLTMAKIIKIKVQSLRSS